MSVGSRSVHGRGGLVVGFRGGMGGWTATEQEVHGLLYIGRVLGFRSGALPCKARKRRERQRNDARTAVERARTHASQVISQRIREKDHGTVLRRMRQTSWWCRILLKSHGRDRSDRRTFARALVKL